MKQVISIWSKQEVTVDETKRKLMSYDNEKRQAIYNAPIIENGETTMFYTDYVENDVVLTDVEERLSAHNSRAAIVYGIAVAGDWKKNDPNRELWDKLVDHAKKHQAEYFLENGNLKDTINLKEIQKRCGRR